MDRSVSYQTNYRLKYETYETLSLHFMSGSMLPIITIWRVPQSKLNAHFQICGTHLGPSSKTQGPHWILWGGAPGSVTQPPQDTQGMYLNLSSKHWKEISPNMYIFLFHLTMMDEYSIYVVMLNKRIFHLIILLWHPIWLFYLDIPPPPPPPPPPTHTHTHTLICV